MSNRERVSTCVLMLRNDKSTFWNYLSIQVFLQFFFVFALKSRNLALF